MSELLIEFFSEEIPPNLQISTRKQFQKLLEEKLSEANIKYKKAKFDFQKKNFSQAKKSLLFVLKNGKNSLKFKSLLLLIMIFLK